MKNPKIETDILTENELKECNNKKNCSGRCLGTIARQQRIKKSICTVISRYLATWLNF